MLNWHGKSVLNRHGKTVLNWHGKSMLNWHGYVLNDAMGEASMEIHCTLITGDTVTW